MRDAPSYMDTQEGSAIRAVENTFKILEALLRLNGAGITELTKEVGLSKSTIHNHLQTLYEMEYVTKEGTTYRVGLSTLTLGGYARDHHKLYRVSWSTVNRLAEETDELALITALHRGQSMYLYQARGAEAVTTDSYVGIRLPLHCTATGKSILASMDPERAEHLLRETELRGFTENTILSIDSLLAELETIREQKIAFDDQERIMGMRGIAASITDRETGEVVGALSVTGPSSRLKNDRFREELPDLIRRNAEMIEVDYTYS